MHEATRCLTAVCAFAVVLSGCTATTEVPANAATVSQTERGPATIARKTDADLPGKPVPPNASIQSEVTAPVNRKSDVEGLIKRMQELTRESVRSTKKLAMELRGTPRPPGITRRHGEPRVGDTYNLSTDLAMSFSAMRRFDQLILADDQVGMAQMEEQGQVQWFTGRLRIIQITPANGLYYCEVRLLDEKQENTFWISRELFLDAPD